MFELPVAAVSKNDIKPRKENDAPVLFYPQDGKGTCGVSSLSSAFHYMFEKNIAAKTHSNKQGHIECLSEPGHEKSKKASSLEFFNLMMMKKECKQYYVHRKRKLMSWKDIYHPHGYYESIFLCIIKSNMFS